MAGDLLSRRPRRRVGCRSPEHWTFVYEVPKTSIGKFDKKVLRRQYADGALEVTDLR